MQSITQQRGIVLLILFLGYVGFSLVFPVLTPIFLEPSYGFIPSTASYFSRNFLLGAIFSMYPLGQFLGAPIIGSLSDRFGRKSILLITLVGVSIFYFLSAFAITFSSLSLLFISRFLTGICEGNVVIANAVMADISSSPKEKTKNFGWALTVSSTGWIVGPLLGGKLADKNIVSWFTFATPFWVTALLLLGSFFFVMLFFKETVGIKHKTSLSFTHMLRSSYRLFKNRSLSQIYIGNTAFYIPVFAFFNFLPILLVHRYGYGPSMLGTNSAYLSIFICLAPLTYPLIQTFASPRKILAFASLFLALSLIGVSLAKGETTLWLSLIFPSYFIALGFSFASIYVSDTASPSIQGEALGVNQSCVVLMEAFVSFLGGSLIAFWIYLPFTIGILSALFAALWFFSLPRNLFHGGEVS